MEFGHGGNYPGVVWLLLNGLVAFFIFLVIVGLIFLLVRFLLTATTAAKIYIAKNTPRPTPASTHPAHDTASGGYTPAPPAESSVASPPAPPAPPEGPAPTTPSTPSPTTPVAKASSKPRTPKTPPTPPASPTV